MPSRDYLKTRNKISNSTSNGDKIFTFGDKILTKVI